MYQAKSGGNHVKKGHFPTYPLSAMGNLTLTIEEMFSQKIVTNGEMQRQPRDLLYVTYNYTKLNTSTPNALHRALLHNTWYQHMTSIGCQSSARLCYVCSLIPQTVGADRLYLSQEVALEKAKCLIHIYLCTIRAKIQPNKIELHRVVLNLTRYEMNLKVLYLFTEPNDIQTELDKMLRKGTIGEDTVWPRDFPKERFLEVEKKPTQCKNMSAPASICGVSVAVSVSGAVFFNNKWSLNIKFLCWAIQLRDKMRNESRGRGFNERMASPCQEIWDTSFPE